MPTNVACRLLDRHELPLLQLQVAARRSCPIACASTPASLKEIDWLPSTCAYRLRGEGKPLPDWHYLVSGDREIGAQGRHVGARLDGIGG